MNTEGANHLKGKSERPAMNDEEKNTKLTKIQKCMRAEKIMANETRRSKE